MTHACEENRDVLVSYIRGELRPLIRARVDSHVGHCAKCALVRDQIASGLQEASDWLPTLEENRLDTMVDRLAPYIQAAETRPASRPFWFVPAVAGATALLVAGLTTIWSMSDSVEKEPAVVASPGVSATPAVVAVIREAPTPHLRLVARADWQGQLRRQGRRTTVTLSRGFVALSFIGGNGRRLRIVTPSASVDVIGTQFFVEISKAGATTVGVSEGRVRVRSGSARTMLGAGEQKIAEAGGGWTDSVVRSVAAAYLDDAYLTEHHATATVTNRNVAAAKRRTIDFGADATPDVLAQLEKAEELALSGEAKPALAIYQFCASNKAPAYKPYRSLCALEAARLLGFTLGNRSDARRIFDRLKRSSSAEVQRQATLALCELDLESAPCAAAACLERVVQEAGADSALQREASRLLTNWGLDGERCSGVHR